MAYRRGSGWIVWLIPGALFGWLACDSEGGLQGASPRVDLYYLGEQDSLPPEVELLATPSDHLAVDFGLVDVAIPEKRYLFLKNTGKGDLKLAGIESLADSSADFFVECLAGGNFKTCPVGADSGLNAAPGAMMVFQLTYGPQDVGNDSAAVQLSFNIPSRPNLVLDLTGQAVTPEVQVCVSDCQGAQDSEGCVAAQLVCNDAVESLQLIFGEAGMEDRLPRTLIVRNQGDRPLQVSRLEFVSGDYNMFELVLEDSGLPGVLPAGQEAAISVIYAPGTGGQHTATLRIDTNDVDEREIYVSVSGDGMAPRACPEPLVLDFGNQDAGQALVQSFDVFNCGLLELEVEKVELTGNTSGDFQMLDPPVWPVLLQPGESVPVSIQYHPLAEGTDSGGANIFSNDPASDPTSHLTGTVQLMGASIPKACDIQATPYAVSFGAVVQNNTKPFSLIISNQGTDTCTLDRVEITANTADSEFTIQTAPATATDFEPGDTLQVLLEYTPIDLGQDIGTLSLFGNDKDTDEVRVDLNGLGVESAICDLQINPSSHNFGMVRVNHVDTVTITLSNLGQAPCNISRLELVPSMMTPGDIRFATPPTLPMVIQPSNSKAIDVTVAPEHPGDHKAYLWVDVDDPDLQQGPFYLGCIPPPALGQACVPISARAEEAAIAVVPDDLDFGVVTTGCNSPELHLTIYNLGAIDLHVDNIYLENPADTAFEIRSLPALPATIAGGGKVQARLRYRAQDTNAHHNTLWIQSDASNEPLLAVPLFGKGTDIADQTDVFHQPTEVKSDVLFVVDNSGSMSEEQKELADNFGAFMNWAITLDVDFQIGVISTEVNDPESDRGDPARDIYPGVLVHPDSRPRIITNTTPDIQNAFRENVMMGTCCSDEQEAGLEAAWMALTEPLVSDPTKNGGFLREDAKLYIICVSDEQDQSQGEPDFYVDFFFSIKGYRNPERMAVSAIVGDAGSGCNNGQAVSGSRYIEVAEQTGGVFQSICTTDWATALQNLSIDAFAAIREFPLSRPADPNTLTVRVEGAVVPRAGCEGCADGWTYYGDTNSIFFGDSVVPDRGQTIEVDYTAACL